MSEYTAASEGSNRGIHRRDNNTIDNLHEMENKKLYSLDLMKVIAVLMITNSHFVPLYKDVNVAFATFGVQGNALFFFVSGFLLMKGWDKQQAVPFPDWCRNKYRRIFPSALVWSVLTAMAIGSGLSVGKLLCADGYWFLQAILVYYVLEYLILRLTSGFGGGQIRGNMVWRDGRGHGHHILPDAKVKRLGVPFRLSLRLPL